MRTLIGIDNGTSGSIGIVGGDTPLFIKTPKYMQQSYTKKKQNISRLDIKKFREFLVLNVDTSNCKAILERPLVNPGAFKTTMSAMRCLEAQLIVLEELNIPYEYVDSKEWQKVMLPNGTKGTSELKKASLDIGCRIFPMCSDVIKKQKDADGILIAEWARRKGL